MIDGILIINIIDDILTKYIKYINKQIKCLNMSVGYSLLC